MTELSRREFLRGTAWLGAGVGLGIVSPGLLRSPIRNPSRTSRPNIVLILADDLGFSDIGCYGSEVRTPNLDKLAAGGLRFSQFYNTARCCPTRASLLTGLYSHQAGVGHMVEDLGYPGYRGYLSDRCITLAEALRMAGYVTLMSGKWHVGEERPHWPVDRGFDHYFGLISGAAHYFLPLRNEPKAGRKMALDDKPIVPDPEGFYMTDAITDYAVRFLRSYASRSRPFFLYVAYTAPHWPLHAWPEDIARYRGKYDIGWDRLRQLRYERLKEMGLISAKWPLSPRDPRTWPWKEESEKELMSLKMAVYAAQIDRMDQGIGRILAALRETGALNNTLILFLSDNGGCGEGGPRGRDFYGNGKPPGGPDSYQNYGLSWANASNTPFRRFKQWVHEGGIATPFIVYWPEVIREGGKITHEVGHVIDIMPTLLEAAGIQYPAEFNGRPLLPLEGRSLLPIFRGERWPAPRWLFWEHQGNRSVRFGKWKLVAGHNEPWELHDLEEDRTELVDLSRDHPDVAKELKEAWEDWANRVGVRPWPIKSESGDG